MKEGKNYSILIIDDETSVLAALSDILRPEYNVYAVKDSNEAVELASERKPDVILLDIVMPEMDGHEVLSELKQSANTKDIPVIFISGLREVEDERKGLSLGAADYIIKPFTPDIVKLRVRNQIKMIDQTRQIIDKELAAKSKQAKMEFLLEMNHEMLTQMNAIIGMTQIAMMGKNPERTTDCLIEIDKASQDLLNLITTLLNEAG